MIVLSPVSAETVPLKLEGRTFLIPVVVNNQIILNFTIDSGAADVSIPEDVFSTLTGTGQSQGATTRESSSINWPTALRCSRSGFASIS